MASHRISLVAALFVLATCSAHAAQCTLSGFAFSPDGAELTVYPAPDAPDPVAVLPAHGDDPEFATEFAITDIRDGWYEIAAASVGQYGTEPERELYAGPGWIRQHQAGFTLYDPLLRDAPGGKIIARLEGADWDASFVTVTAAHACIGDALDADLALPDGTTRRGWVTGLCANQVTTCS